MKEDVINRANHYTYSAVEPIAAVEAWNLNFNLGNVVKYIARHKHKNGLEDLRKARWYLEREIENYQRATITVGTQQAVGTIEKTPGDFILTREVGGRDVFVGSPHGDTEQV